MRVAITVLVVVVVVVVVGVGVVVMMRENRIVKKILLALTTMVTIVPVWVSFPSSKDRMSATSFLHRSFFPVMLLSVLVHKRLNPLCFFVCGPAFLSAVCVRVSACSVPVRSV